MAGRMGGKFRTIKKLRVMRIDNALNLVYVRGAVPGHDDTMVRVMDTRIGGNRPIFTAMPPPYPTFIPSPGQTLPRLLVASGLDQRSTIISNNE
jgi:large subunit ribosomal protein L3